MVIEGVGALVTGGASGLGAATVRRLAAGGAAVTVVDTDAPRAAALARELGRPARSVAADVTDPAAVQAAVEAAGSQWPLRLAISCAGVGWAQRTLDRSGTPHDFEAFRSVLGVNLLGTFNVLRLAAAAMAGNDPLDDGERGVVVNTASVAAFDGQSGQLAYAASKGGVVSMTLPAARDLAAVGVRVLTIAPGVFDTPMLATLPEDRRQALAAGIPFPNRLGHPDEYAALVEHLCRNRALNGETIRLDGALRMPAR